MFLVHLKKKVKFKTWIEFFLMKRTNNPFQKNLSVLVQKTRKFKDFSCKSNYLEGIN